MLGLLSATNIATSRRLATVLRYQSGLRIMQPMRYKTILPTHVEQQTVDAGTTCDLCHDSLDKDDRLYLHNEVELTARLGEVYCEGDNRTAYETDCCAACFTSKVVPALAAIGLVFRERPVEGYNGEDGREWATGQQAALLAQ